MEPRKKKLFLSFHHMLILLFTSKVNEEDLKGALFFFSCERWVVFPEGDRETAATMKHIKEQLTYVARTAPGTIDMSDDNIHRTLTMVQRAIDKAEQDGRCDWRWLRRPVSMRQLDRLLSYNGYPRFVRDDDLIEYVDGGTPQKLAELFGDRLKAIL